MDDRQEELQRKQSQEKQLKDDIHNKQLKVVSLNDLKQQLDEMRDMLSQLVRQLPGKTEMPELLIEISQRRP